MSEALSDIACPAGDSGKVLGVVLSCYQQAIILTIFGLILPVACCLYCCFRRFGMLRGSISELPMVAKWSNRSESPPLRDGEVRCGEFGHQSFSVVSKPEARRLKISSDRSGASSRTTGVSSKGESSKRSRELQVLPSPEAERDDDDVEAQEPAAVELPTSKSRLSLASAWSALSSKAKVHVVWNLNLRQAQEWLAGRTCQVPNWTKSVGNSSSQANAGREQPDEVSCTPSDGKEQRPVLPHPTHSKPASGRGLWEADEPKDCLTPAYTNSERVEYFSPTYGSWILGDVQIHLNDRSSPEAVYSVTVFRTAQERHHVELESLRLPLRPGEHCELWSREEQKWLPAVVVKMEAGSSAFRHYMVHLCGTDGPAAREQASLLRRRFLPGSAVQVYRGLQRGWVPARVAGEAPASAESSCADLDQVLEADDVPREQSSEELKIAALRKGGSQTVQKADGSKLDYVVTVPIVEDSSCQPEQATQAPELVPSYLIRFCPKAWKLLPEGHEDLEAVVSL